MVDNPLVGVHLPSLERTEFDERLLAASGLPLEDDAIDRLFIHYGELCRWNRRISLVGPAAAREVIERHYAESLAGLELLGVADLEIVDIGSGAGFPALVVAAARPDLRITLIEANERKWSFLMSASRKMSLPCRCLNARVGGASIEGMPEQIDVVMSRAVSETDLGLDTLLPRMSPQGSLLLWVGESAPKKLKTFQRIEELRLPRSRTRRILKLRTP